MFSTDKVEHGYLPFYLDVCSRLSIDQLTGERPVIVELGVRDGSSLMMWRSLVPDAIVMGVDNSAAANMTVEGTEFLHCDHEDPRLFEMIREVYRRKFMLSPDADFGDPFVDLLVDDGSHDGRITGLSFTHLWPLVKPGGLYVIEDWYVGGEQWPSYDRSMLTLAEQLVSLVLDRDAPVASVEYRYGLIAIRRGL